MCSVWREMHMRSSGITVRKEDIRKATMSVRITSTESFGYYNSIKLTPAQKRNYRWHNYHLELSDDRFRSSCMWRGGIITRLGNTGKEMIEGFMDEVLKEYKYFDGYECDELKGHTWKEVITEKNKKMVSLIRKMVAEHNDQMMQEVE